MRNFSGSPQAAAASLAAKTRCAQTFAAALNRYVLRPDHSTDVEVTIYFVKLRVLRG
jgi:hypothetical protein